VENIQSKINVKVIVYGIIIVVMEYLIYQLQLVARLLGVKGIANFIKLLLRKKK
jgi:hypothetical protein